jgi:Family of unknown function (DUF6491)
VIRRHRIVQIALVAAVMSAAGCATSEPQSRNTVSAQTYNDCIYGRMLTDWRPLDRQNLILFAGGHQAYHVVLFSPAMGLDFSVMIGVYDRDGRICPYGGDAIIVDGPIPERIPIRSIRRLTDAELDELYVQFGISKPKIVTETAIPPEGGESK